MVCIVSNCKGTMSKIHVQCCLILLTFWMSCCINVHAEGVRRASGSGPVVKKDERWPVVSNEYGEISAVRISDAVNGSYLLHFFTLEPSCLLLPLLLNTDMLFYVHAGSGRLSWTEEDELKHMNIKRGDVYKLVQGSVFYIRTQEQRLKIDAIFANSNDDLLEPATEPYSSIQDMVLGFDKPILQATFKVSEEVIDELLGTAKPPVITHTDNFCRGDKSTSCEVLELNKRKKDTKEKDKDKKEKEKEKEKDKEENKLFNILEEEKRIENCNGWSTTVTKKQLAALEGSNIGLFMVNLTAGSMMEPHWNTMDTEVIVVVEGRGMVRVCSPSIAKERGAGREMRLAVEQGDVFVVPRSHPTAQLAFNNGSFVFMGFTRMDNTAHFLAGQTSVLRLLTKDVLQLSFNVKRATLDELLAPRDDSVISACISCAEEEMQIMQEGGEGGRRHGGDDEEETGREEEAEWRHEREREEEEEAEWRHERERREEEEEEPEWRHGGEEGEEKEAQGQNHHHYVQGVRRILRRN